LYQYCKNSITRQHRLYPKTSERERESSHAKELNPSVVTLPYAEPPKETQLVEELRVLRVKENECWSEISNKMDEVRELLDTRKKELADVRFVLSVYDTLRNRPRETEAELEQMRAEEQRKAESRKDYLAPYIANLDIAKSCKGDYTNIRLNAEEAKRCETRPCEISKSDSFNVGTSCKTVWTERRKNSTVVKQRTRRTSIRLRAPKIAKSSLSSARMPLGA